MMMMTLMSNYVDHLFFIVSWSRNVLHSYHVNFDVMMTDDDNNDDDDDVYLKVQFTTARAAVSVSISSSGDTIVVIVIFAVVSQSSPADVQTTRKKSLQAQNIHH